MTRKMHKGKPYDPYFVITDCQPTLLQPKKGWHAVRFTDHWNRVTCGHCLNRRNRK